MKQLILGLTVGLAVGLTCAGCSIAKAHLTAEPM